MPSLTANAKGSLYRAVRRKCVLNGYNIAFALRTGLMLFLKADHEDLVKLIKKYNRIK
jgi:hypothetical protein